MKKKLVTLVLLWASVALLAGCVSNEEVLEEDTAMVPVVEEVTPEVVVAPEMDEVAPEAAEAPMPEAE